MTYIEQAQTANVADGAITAAKIAAGTITATELGTDSVGSDEIAAGAVDTSELAAGAVTDAKVDAAAAIALSKLATDPLARANHTGTQLASTVSDFDTQVRTSRLDQMATPTAGVAMGSQKLTGLADGTAATDAVTKQQLDAVDPSSWSCLVKTANYTVADSDDMIIADSTSGNVTITMPAAPSAGNEFVIKKQVSANQVTVAGNGKNIDGSANYSLNSGSKDSLTIVFCSALDAYVVI